VPADAKPQYWIVLTTCPSKGSANKLAALLLKARLCACVQISSKIRSHYWWKGRLEKAQEYQLWIKTRADLWPKLQKTISQHHPFDVPEIIGIPMGGGNAAYLNWIDRETLAKSPLKKRKI